MTAQTKGSLFILGLLLILLRLFPCLPFQVFNYVEAVKNLPTNFSNAEITPIINRINPRLVGQIKSLFIVLSDDLYRPRGPPQSSATSSRPATTSRALPTVPQPSGVETEGSQESGSESDSMEQEVAIDPPPRLHPIRRSLPRAARTARALAVLKKGALQPSSLGVPKNNFL